jgi:hypothetical protein
MNSTKYEDRFAFESAARVVVTFCCHIWKITPLIRVDIIDLTGGAWANATTSNNDVPITDGTGWVTMSSVLHIWPGLKHVFVTLLNKFTAFNMWPLSRILEISSTNHKDIAISSCLNNLEVVW